ncbi:MAG: hypothetical protein J6Y36_03895 [Treponema sp.]|uniref:hypothetical protein n=1 Tax=Treponema sp. TaxID=166 RepID=UPI001B64C29E|nr:hypothetical protein [Treponema sp.]MBP5402284.1 hypothetical protein [Treponema sp.]MBR5933218.1 hypothetical protein [Treponema sp.]
MQVQTEEKFKECCHLLKKGEFLQADEMLNEILVNALDDERIQFATNCSSYWTNVLRQMLDVTDSYERGEIFIHEWEQFLSFTEKQKYKADENVVYCYKSGVFSLALDSYSKLLDVQDFEQRAEICRKVGLCYKKLGEYVTAKNCLSESNKLKPGVSSVIAELADCYALCGEDREAKVLFREAFFVDAVKINLCYLDSELIWCLIRKIEEKGYTGAVLQSWIPVYGHLFAIFTVKRQLRPQEVSRLKQEIYAAENEMKDPMCNSELLTPRLCNLYFWLIDHYAMNNEDNSRIKEILMRIKILDPVIYSMYIK